jgi:hypothetical protein
MKLAESVKKRARRVVDSAPLFQNPYYPMQQQQQQPRPPQLAETAEEDWGASEGSSFSASAPGSRIGLVRLLSFSPAERESFYKAASDRWILGDSAIYEDLFGRETPLKHEIEGKEPPARLLPALQAEVPRHDELGRFPLLADGSGRQYFDATSSGDVDAEVSLQGFHRTGDLWLFVRLPRWKTAAISSQLGIALYEDAMDFPAPGTKLLLDPPLDARSQILLRGTTVSQQRQEEMRGYLERTRNLTAFVKDLAVPQRGRRQGATAAIQLHFPSLEDRFSVGWLVTSSSAVRAEIAQSLLAARFNLKDDAFSETVKKLLRAYK